MKSQDNNRTRRPARLLIPVRGYFILMNMVLLCLLFPTISYYFFQKTTTFRDTQLERAVEDRKAELEARAAYLVQSLSHSATHAISGYNFTFLNNLTREAVKSDAELLSCQFISEAAPEVAAGFGPPDIDWYEVFAEGVKREKIRFPSTVAQSYSLPVSRIYHNSFAGDGAYPVLQAVAPVYVGDSLWGTVHAAFTLKTVEKDIETLNREWAEQMQQYRISLLSITSIFFFLGVVAALLFTRPLIRSIYSLRDGFEKVAGGDLSQKIDLNDIFSCREFFSLSRSFNHMTDNLRHSKQQLDDYSRSLEDKVEERTRELKETQAELVSQAHEAGMAEMAVDVLHNIGNAVTPVKVSTSMLAKRLRTSSLRTRLGRAMHQFPEVIQAAPHLPEKEKERLIAITTLVPESIREEFNNIIKEVESIGEKNRYIEEIIRLQMHYAKLPTAKDLIDVNKVTMDALKIIEDLIARHDIEVETRFGPVPLVRFEQSKLLQILLNLIKNGCEAMFDNTGGEKKLTITTFQDDSDSSKVIVSVRDTGSGFSGEEKRQLFTFGYSTKKRGTGLGLHSSANYLIANDGSIEARSDGPGRGAEFVVHLPAATPSERET